MNKHLAKIIKPAALTLTVIAASACSTTQEALKEPEFAPAMPIAAEERAEVNGAIFHANTNRFLFEDIKARRVGDLITVILDEKTNAAKTASTNTNKESSIDMPGPTLFGLPVTHNGRPILDNKLSSNTGFTGSGDSSQSNSLSGNITVTVAEVLNNGNMVVRGEKLLTLNNGSEVVRISGIIRPVDVTPENTIISTQISNANITYSGNGAVADSNKQGWLTRFFNSRVWPF
ncbi:MAG: flagellar basal body L-ring protein FlgH [Gammaproteobacteria bacterium]|nr:flagellar basal body L-ring protein FlgH [Gammaproteobacteria bacterium]